MSRFHSLAVPVWAEPTGQHPRSQPARAARSHRLKRWLHRGPVTGGVPVVDPRPWSPPDVVPTTATHRHPRKSVVETEFALRAGRNLEEIEEEISRGDCARRRHEPRTGDASSAASDRWSADGLSGAERV
jgi:hypothetical protein